MELALSLLALSFVALAVGLLMDALFPDGSFSPPKEREVIYTEDTERCPFCGGDVYSGSWAQETCIEPECRAYFFMGMWLKPCEFDQLVEKENE